MIRTAIKVWWKLRQAKKRIRKCLDRLMDRVNWEAEWKAHCMGTQGSRYIGPDPVMPVGKTAGRRKARSPKIRAKRGKATNRSC